MGEKWKWTAVRVESRGRRRTVEALGNTNQTVSGEDCVHRIHLGTPGLSVFVSGVFVCALGFIELQITCITTAAYVFCIFCVCCKPAGLHSLIFQKTIIQSQ